MAADIRIDDLAAPVLTPDQLAMRSMAATLVLEMEPARIMEAARKQTGLEDFGPMDFVERLDVLCRAVNADEGLHQSGRASVFFDCVRYCANRLRIHDVLTRYPEIHDEVIERPVVVAGLPRSGTTHLLNLMAADRRFRSIPYWESREPVADPTEAQRVPGEDPRYTRCREAWEQTDSLMPLVKAMHAMTPDHVHEELELMCPDFASYNFEWLFDAPSWRDYYFSHDQGPHYDYMRTALKLLQWQDRQRGEPARRWVLKCPQHLEQLPVLMATFPDATVALTHRDPTSVVASAVTMLSYGDRMRRKVPDPVYFAGYWSERIERLLAACTRDRDIVPPDQSVDVLFHEFMADDIAMVERIYDKAGIEMTTEAREDLNGYMQANPRGAHGRVVYDMAADFGIDRAELRERFEPYITRFGVRPEGDR